MASCSDNAMISEARVYRNPHATAWRAILKVFPKGAHDRPIDVRCALRSGDDWVSETWTYRWSPR